MDRAGGVGTLLVLFMSAERVVIVGGGPAGATAALVLAGRGLAVTVVETSPGPRAKVGECLPPTLGPLIERLGLAEALAAGGHLRSYGNRFVWGGPEVEERPFLTGTAGDGWHVDRRRFEALLAARAARAGVDWRWGTRFVSCERVGGGWRLETAVERGDRAALDAAFVADASGRRSSLARRLGARRLRYDRLVGVAATCASASPDVDRYTLVEAVERGWWYSALLGSGRLAVAFLSDGDLLDPGLRGIPESGRFEALLEATELTRDRVRGHDYRLDGMPRVLPAESSRLDRIAGPHWLALGDAAAAYDPLSSHGIGSAMGSGYYAGHAIADLLAGRAEAGDAYLSLMQRAYGTYLDLQRRHYARERRFPDSEFWRRRQLPEYGLAFS